MKQKVLGFSVEEYNKKQLSYMSDRNKFETYLEDQDNVVCYDCVEDFFNELNDDMVDTENNFWYVVNVDAI